jgi:hypothetical protein
MSVFLASGHVSFCNQPIQLQYHYVASGVPSTQNKANKLVPFRRVLYCCNVSIILSRVRVTRDGVWTGYYVY